MPQRRIFNVSGQPHFLTFSTYQRRRFLDSGETRDIVLEVLQQCLQARQTKCAGFVVMPNHGHAIISGDDQFNISAFVQVWKKTSSYRIKRFFARELSRYNQLCPDGCAIWQAGFYDFNIDTDLKLREKLEYMHNNPVVAGLTENARVWTWSSARFYELGESVGVDLTPSI